MKRDLYLNYEFSRGSLGLGQLILHEVIVDVIVVQDDDGQAKTRAQAPRKANEQLFGPHRDGCTIARQSVDN